MTTIDKIPIILKSSQFPSQNITMARSDLRTIHQTRPISTELALISESDGSAQFSQGNSCAIATVVGPAQPRYSRHEQYDRASLEIEVEVAGKSKDALECSQVQNTCREFLQKSLESCIELQSFPRMLILIKVLVMRDDGSLFAVALNACTLALLESGLPMKYVPTGVSLCTSCRNNSDLGAPVIETFLDPDAEEEQCALSVYSFATHPNTSQIDKGGDSLIIHSHCIGEFDQDAFFSAVECAKQAGVAIHSTFRRLMTGKLMPESRS